MDQIPGVNITDGQLNIRGGVDGVTEPGEVGS